MSNGPPVLGTQDDSVIITGHSVEMDFREKNIHFKELPNPPRRKWELQSSDRIREITVKDLQANTTTTLIVSPGLTFVFGYRIGNKLNQITIGDTAGSPVTVDCDAADFHQPSLSFKNHTAKLQSFVEILQNGNIFRVLQINPSACEITLHLKP